MQKSKFENKRTKELARLAGQKVHTCSVIRVKFPDQYVLEGTFGALEELQAVYIFVRKCLVDESRQFQLYETPPKKLVKDLNSTLYSQGMVPTRLLYFQWKNENEGESTQYLDLKILQNYIQKPAEQILPEISQSQNEEKKTY